MEIIQNVSSALVVLLGLVSTGLALSTKYRDLSIWIGFAASCFLCLTFFSWLQNHHWKKDETEARTMIKAGNKPFPNIPIPLGRPPHAPESAWTIYNDEITLLIGPFVVSTSSKTFTILRLYDRDILGVTINDGLARIDADVWDEDRRLLATLERNRLRVNHNNTLPLIRPDPHTLIIQNEKKEDVFYFEFLNKKCIKIKGIFRSAGKYPVIISDEEISFGPLVFGKGMALHIQGGAIFEWPGRRTEDKIFLTPDQEIKANTASLGYATNNGAINIMVKMNNGEEYSIFQIGGANVPKGTHIWAAFDFMLKEAGTY